MVSIQKLRQLALAYPGCTEQPHFEKRAFRIAGKRIFCTLSENDQTATVRLTAIDQSVYCQIDPAVIYPVPNKWGKQGWTIIALRKISVGLMKEILEKAYDAAK